MVTILDTILEHKRAEVAVLRRQGRRFSGRERPARAFIDALARRPRLSLIAEVKRASPSRGIIAENFDPVKIAERYEAGGAQALSVLTDERFFQGSPEFLVRVGEAVSLPVLRKDFIIDPLQVEQSAGLGADALLLIAAALSNAQLEELYRAAEELEIVPLVEVHTMREAERVMRLDPPVLGINNRDLATFSVDIGTTLAIAAELPPEKIIVSESGIMDGSGTARLMAAGVSAVLVGEVLMRLEDPGPLIEELLHADSSEDLRDHAVR